jgi:septal ring factor EnvC (AmiA/AmiB activator)
MSGERRFRTSTIGFNKSDVNSYIEKMLREFEDKIKEKDNEIAELKAQIIEISRKYEEVAQSVNQVKDDRDKIADVLIKAQQQAETIIQEARNQFTEEKKRLEALNEMEREKIVDMKEKVKYLRNEAVRVLKTFEEDLSTLVEETEE